MGIWLILQKKNYEISKFDNKKFPESYNSEN